MKRIFVLLLAIACIFAASGCKSGSTMTETSTYTSNDTVSEATLYTSNPSMNDWSEQDITAMFTQVKKSDWQYIDCVLIPDHASDRIGAVLFWDDAKGTSSVAFFDADGYYQQCGVYAKISSDPDFTYLGDGSVTYKLEKEDGATYNCTLAISTDGDNVQFKVETDPLTQK